MSAHAAGSDWALRPHHIGVTVADLDRSVAFWSAVLEREPFVRDVIDGPHLGVLLGYPGVKLGRALFELGEGVRLELLRYIDRDEPAYDPATAHPGNVHICLQVADLDGLWRRAVAAGAVPASDEPVIVPSGPAAGTRLAMLRSPDGVSIEALEPPR